MATGHKDKDFKLVTPDHALTFSPGDYGTLPCHLSPETSAVAMEIRWFNERDCIYLYKNGHVTEGRGYEGRVSVNTQELQRGDVSLRLRESGLGDGGVYTCQVISGEHKAEGRFWLRYIHADIHAGWTVERDVKREITAEERMRMEVAVQSLVGGPAPQVSPVSEQRLVEEMRESYEREARAEAERNHMKFVTDWNRHIINTQQKTETGFNRKMEVRELKDIKREFNRQMEEKDAEMEDMKREFNRQMEEKERQKSEKDGEIEEKDREMEDMKREFSREMEEKDGEIEEKDGEIEDMKREFNRQMEEKDSEIEEKDREMKNMKKEFNRQMEVKDWEIEDKDKAIKEKDSEIEDKNSEIEDKDREIEEKNREIEDKDREIEEKNSEIEDKDREIEEMKDLLQQGGGIECDFF